MIKDRNPVTYNYVSLWVGSAFCRSGRCNYRLRVVLLYCVCYLWAHFRVHIHGIEPCDTWLHDNSNMLTLMNSKRLQILCCSFSPAKSTESFVLCVFLQRPPTPQPVLEHRSLSWHDSVRRTTWFFEFIVACLLGHATVISGFRIW
jgi:hypothetical protein